MAFEGTGSKATDEALVTSLKGGDESALVELMRRHQRFVFGMAYRYLGNAEDAADVAQEVFVKVYRGIGGFAGNAKFQTWLYRIAANTAINALRNQKRRGDAMTESLDALQEQAKSGPIEAKANPGPTPLECLERKELAGVLQEKLQELPEGYRMAFVLRELRQLSYDEIAEALDIPVGTVRSRLHHARLRLREMLEPYLRGGERVPAGVAQARF